MLHCCHQCFFLSHCVHWPQYQLLNLAFIIIKPSKGPQKGKNGQKLTLSGLWPYGTPYLMERVGTRLERHLDYPGWSFCPFSRPRMSQMLPYWGQKGATNLKIHFWPHKSAQRAYFGLEGVERGWNTNEDIQKEQFGPFTRPRMSQIWFFRAQKWTKIS